MLLDARTYTCRPGTINKHLELYERRGKRALRQNTLVTPCLHEV
ncbi:MAG: hypothetical protein CM1200mP41_33570 [Gammaproteobacteria bacterium]|nr:MAG: hypothetical protein CM1200mP41_33570 [Gammaproteobacteria bacterium]